MRGSQQHLYFKCLSSSIVIGECSKPFNITAPLSTSMKEERKAEIRFLLAEGVKSAHPSIPITSTTCTLSSMVDVDGLPDLSSSHKEVLPCLKHSIHSLILLHD
ncbi:hypothetical protein TNCV_4957151 [Trichonephila clavipes]|nr:hypothetical protein TNCV_4957151 [Trichonephila clavipes]